MISEITGLKALREKLSSSARSSILMGNKKDYGREGIDVFLSDGKLSHKGNKISAVIFCTLDFSSLLKLRIAEIYLMQLLSHCDIGTLKKEKNAYLKKLTCEILIRFRSV